MSGIPVLVNLADGRQGVALVKVPAGAAPTEAQLLAVIEASGCTKIAGRGEERSVHNPTVVDGFEIRVMVAPTAFTEARRLARQHGVSFARAKRMVQAAETPAGKI